MNTRDQYRQEMEQRYLKYVQKEEARESASRKALVDKEKDRRKRSTPTARTPPTATGTMGNVPVTSAPNFGRLNPSATTLGRYVPSAFRVSTLVIDSAFRDTNLYPQANQFVVKLADPLRNVAAIRLLRTEFYQPSNTTGYFVMNEVRIPLQLYNIESAYLYLNGYQSMQVVQELNTTFFARIGPGTEIYPAVTGDIRQDPLMYSFLPVEPKLRRFSIKLLQADGSIYDVNNARVVVTLAVYCLTPGM